MGMKNKARFFIVLSVLLTVIVLSCVIANKYIFQKQGTSPKELYVNGQRVQAVLEFTEVNGKDYVEIPFLSVLEALGFQVSGENDTIAVWNIEDIEFISDLSASSRGAFYKSSSPYKSDEIFPGIGQDWGYRKVRDGDIYLDQESLRTTFSELGINAHIIIDFEQHHVDIID